MLDAVPMSHVGLHAAQIFGLSARCMSVPNSSIQGVRIIFVGFAFPAHLQLIICIETEGNLLKLKIGFEFNHGCTEFGLPFAERFALLVESGCAMNF